METFEFFRGRGRSSATNWKRFNALLVLPFLATLTSASFAHSRQVDMSKQESGVSNQMDNEAKGKALRKAIDERYESLDRAKAIKPIGAGQNNIDDVVLKFIPIGTSFADAEEILASAGFKVGRPGNQPPLLHYFAVRGSIDQYAPTPFGKTSVVIDLQPKDATDWSAVHALSAVILRQFI